MLESTANDTMWSMLWCNSTCTCIQHCHIWYNRNHLFIYYKIVDVHNLYLKDKLNAQVGEIIFIIILHVDEMMQLSFSEFLFIIGTQRLIVNFAI